jgi:hypothetical protein
VAGLFDPLVRALAGRQLILHAGTPKTGSTALQCWLTEHREQLLAQGILYPSNVSDPDKPKHQWLLESLRPGQGERLCQQAEQIATQLNRRAPDSVHSVLLSTEGIYNHFHDVVAVQQAEWAQLVSQCATRLVVVFRNPLGFALSRYRQNILNPPSNHPYHGTSKSIDELCSDPQWLRAMDYQPFLAFWEHLIGRSRIHCLPYSQASTNRFCRLLEIKLPHGCGELPRRNPSVEHIGVELIRSINQLQLYPGHREQVIQHIRKAEESLPQHVYRFQHSPASREAVIAYCRDRHGDLIARYPELTLELDCHTDTGSSTKSAVLNVEGKTTNGCSTDLAYVCCIQPGFLEEQVIALVQSIRLFGGAFRDQPVYVVSPWGECISNRTCLILEALDARLIVASLNQKLRAFPYANKAYALEWIENQHRHAVHVFLDSDTLIVDEPSGLAIEGETDFAARPVDLRGICSSPLDDTFRNYWTECCRLFDVELEMMPVIQSTVDRQPIYANWNGGLLAMRGDRSVGQRWREVLETLWERQLCPRPQNFWGSGQVGFAIAVESLGLKGKILDVGYNIPFHLEPSDVGISEISQPKHLHYHWMLESKHRREWNQRIQSLKLNRQPMKHLKALPPFQMNRGPSCTGFNNSH